MNAKMTASRLKQSVVRLLRGRQRCLGNERGIALIIAVGMLALLSILGVTLMSYSTSEVKLSGNYNANQEAQLAADRAVEYAIGGVAIGNDVVDLYNGTDAGGTLHRSRVSINRGGLLPTPDPPVDDRNTVRFVGVGTPPVGIGSDINQFQARNYVISVTGVFPDDQLDHARVDVRAQVAKIVPK